MNRNKIVEHYCPTCQTVKTPKQLIVNSSDGLIAHTILPATCPECNAHLQRHVTRVPKKEK